MSVLHGVCAAHISNVRHLISEAIDFVGNAEIIQFNELSCVAVGVRKELVIRRIFFVTEIG